MRKTVKLAIALIAICIVACLSSCSKSGADALQYVPADATAMAYFDGEMVLGQAGYKDGTVGEPLKGFLEKNGVDVSDEKVKETIKVMSMFTVKGAAFYKNDEVWVILGLKDTKGFIDYLVKEQDFVQDKEDGIVYVEKDKGYIMFKDDMAFACIDLEKGRPVLETDGLKEICNLGDNSFADNEKTSEIAKRIVEERMTLYAIANLDKVQGMVNESDFNNFMIGLSAIFNNPKYASLESVCTEKGSSVTVRVLDKDYKGAKCSLPFGKIDANALPYAAVPDNCVAGALAMPSSMVNKVIDMVGMFMQTEELSMIGKIDGTIAVTCNPKPTNDNDIAALVVTTKGNSDAVALGDYINLNLGSSSFPLRCSTSDKYLRVSMKDSSNASGDVKYSAEVLSGKIAGIVIDYNKLVKSVGVGGDFEDLGVCSVYLESVDGSVVLKLDWKCDNPIKKSFKMIELLQNADNLFDNIGFAQPRYDIPLDTLEYEVVEPAAYDYIDDEFYY